VILASELIRLPGSEMDICKTDYMKLALNALIRESIEGGLYRETVRQIPELTATGSTWDECRTNLFNAILEWIRNRQKEGLDLPPPG